MMIWVGMNHFHDIYLDIPNHQPMPKNSKCEPITPSCTQQYFFNNPKNIGFERNMVLKLLLKVLKKSQFSKSSPKSWEFLPCILPQFPITSQGCLSHVMFHSWPTSLVLPQPWLEAQAYVRFVTITL